MLARSGSTETVHAKVTASSLQERLLDPLMLSPLAPEPYWAPGRTGCAPSRSNAYQPGSSERWTKSNQSRESSKAVCIQPILHLLRTIMHRDTEVGQPASKSRVRDRKGPSVKAESPQALDMQRRSVEIRYVGRLIHLAFIRKSSGKRGKSRKLPT